MSNVKKLAFCGMFAALAYITTYYASILRIPLVPVPYLHYDPKDIIIVMCGLIFGPLSVLMVSVTVSYVEMITVSTTGYWGFIMNVLSTCAFALTASAIYKLKRGFIMSVVSLIAGTLVMAAVMLPWNYLVVPLYTSMPREQILPLLTTIFLPFNLLKGGINTVLTIIIFAALRPVLIKSNLINNK